MNSNGPRKKMITICSTLVAIGLINLIISIYSKMTAQHEIVLIVCTYARKVYGNNQNVSSQQTRLPIW